MSTDLERVKAILLGAEYEELLALKRRFESREELTEEIAAVIAEALESRARMDNRVSDVLAPTIDQAITSSIDQDPKKLAESLYPIMGPAIRKSITETLQQMLDNFNQLLEQSLSPQSLKWRFDAWRTGRSYSEMVLLNTLEYEVEQVFLIHLETSLLIRHAYSDTAEQRDPDMVSGMFSAIQDFIQDSFSVSEDDVLDTLRLGGLNVVIQRGPTAILAVVVRGSIPEQLRNTLKTTSERIYQNKKEALRDFSGDPAPFADLEVELKDILDQRHRLPEKSRGVPWLALVSILLLAAIGAHFYYQASLRYDSALAAIHAFDDQPGVVVVSRKIEGDKATVFALVDPSIGDPTALLNLPGSALRTAAYFSAEDEIIEYRAVQKLKPENQTTLSVSDGNLYLSGSATQQWLRQALPIATQIAGINGVDDAELKVTNPVLDELAQNKRLVTGFNYVFEKESAEIDTADPALAALAASIQRVIALRQAEGMKTVSFDAVGYTDNSGSVSLNRQIGLQRALNLVSALEVLGVSDTNINAFNGLDYDNAPVLEGREVRLFIRD